MNFISPDEAKRGPRSVSNGRERVWLYVMAVATPLATLGLRHGLAFWFGERPLLILFVLPVILSAAAG